MISDLQEPGPFQFRLRSLLAFTVVVAVGVALVKWVDSPVFFLFTGLVSISVAISCWLCGRIFNRLFNWFGHRQPFKTCIVVIFVLSISAAVYGCWTINRIRSEDFWESPFLQPFPYPDSWCCELADWYDARFPVEGVGIKIHGEWPRVESTIRFATAALLGLVAFCGGLLTRRVWLYQVLVASWKKARTRN